VEMDFENMWEPWFYLTVLTDSSWI